MLMTVRSGRGVPETGNGRNGPNDHNNGWAPQTVTPDWGFDHGA